MRTWAKTIWVFLLSNVLANVVMLAANINAPSLLRAEVQSVIDSAADGDIVYLPIGTATWTNSIVTVSEKLITVTGAGTNLTHIISDNANRGSVLMWDIRLTTKTNGGGCFVLKNLWMSDSDTYTGTNGTVGMIKVTASNNLGGNTSPWRLCSNLIQNAHCRIGQFRAWTGLIDNNYFDSGNTGISIDNQFTTLTHGDDSWSTPVQTGTTNEGVYIEHNRSSHLSGGAAFTDGFAGARIVARYNALTNTSVENHGTESTLRDRGGRWLTAYGNTFTRPATQGTGERALLYRSGSGVIFSNILVGAWTGIARLIYEKSRHGYQPWNQSNGTNLYDVNDAVVYGTGTHNGLAGAKVLSVAGSPFVPNEWIGSHFQNKVTGKAGEVLSNTPNTVTFSSDPNSASAGYTVIWNPGDNYEIRKVVIALDAPGRGQGDAFATLGSDSVPPTPIAFPNEVDAPIYYWANTGTGSSTIGAYYFIIAGRDYTNAVNTSYTPLSDPHPLALLDSGGGPPPPNPPVISPLTSSVTNSQTIQFSAAFGTTPYNWRIQGNQSGCSISSTGLYQAGNLAGTDIVRVTDAASLTADATVVVTIAVVNGTNSVTTTRTKSRRLVL